MGSSDGGESGRAERARTRGKIPKFPLLHGWRHGRITGLRIAPGGIKHPIRAVRQGGHEYQLQEDSQNGLPPIPGGGNTARGGVKEKDDGSRAFLPVEAAGVGTVHGVRGGDGARVAGGPSIEAAWEGSRWETELGNHGPRKGDKYLQDGLPNF